MSGRVTFDGKPVTSGSVILYCEGKQIVHGVIGPDGTYTVPNVPFGTTIATVHAHAPVPAGFHVKAKFLPPFKDGPIPPRVDHSNEVTIALIPERFGVPEESGLNLTVDRQQLVFNIDLTP